MELYVIPLSIGHVMTTEQWEGLIHQLHVWTSNIYCDETSCFTNKLEVFTHLHLLLQYIVSLDFKEV